MSIRWKLLLAVIAILVMTLGQLYCIFTMNSLQQETTLQVNVAGRQRMLSQKMTKEGIHYLYTGETEALQAAEASVRTFENALSALRQGGKTAIGSREVAVAATTDAQIKAALQEAESYWQQVRPLFTDRLRQAPGLTPEERSSLEKDMFAASLQLLERFDRITTMYEQASAVAVQKKMIYIYLFLGLTIAAAVIAWWYTQYYVVRPLLNLRDQALRIAEGDLSLKE